MKQNHFIKCHSMALTALLGVSAWMLASCAEDGYDDESFASTTYNSQLLSPNADDITITASADGRSQTFEWPVVHGAGGYLVSLYNLEDQDNPIVADSLIDGCSVKLSRVEDTNYKFLVQTIGDKAKGNTDATATTELTFNTFAVALADIPTGTDLVEYFTQNPVPDSTEAIYYNLEGGGTYMINSTLDFSGHRIVLRSTDKTNRPTIFMGSLTTTSTDEEGGETMTTTVGTIATSAPMTLQNLIIDCSGIPDDTKNYAPVTLSATPDATIKAKTGGGTYYNIMTYPIYIYKCDFKDVKGMLFYDSNVSGANYCVETLLIEDCRVQFNVQLNATGGTNWANLAYIWLPQGFVKDLTIKNSTMWNVGPGNLQYGIRYNNSGRLDRAGYDNKTQSQSVNHLNSTFYNMAYGQWANYDGFRGYSYSHFDIENNIFVECGVGGSGIARRLLGGRAASSYGECIFLQNTYWVKGAPEKEGAPNDDPESPSTYDTSHTALQTDPALVNPEGGDLTPTGAEQVQYQTGDPYWWQ